MHATGDVPDFNNYTKSIECICYDYDIFTVLNSKFTVSSPTLDSLSFFRTATKMATSGKHAAFCVHDFRVNKSVVSVQQHFQTKFWTDLLNGVNS